MVIVQVTVTQKRKILVLVPFGGLGSVVCRFTLTIMCGWAQRASKKNGIQLALLSSIFIYPSLMYFI